MVNVSVSKKKDETIESLISRFKRKVVKSGVIKDFRDKDFFKTESFKKREKRKYQSNQKKGK